MYLRGKNQCSYELSTWLSTCRSSSASKGSGDSPGSWAAASTAAKRSCGSDLALELLAQPVFFARSHATSRGWKRKRRLPASRMQAG